jgi:hypothetical protein
VRHLRLILICGMTALLLALLLSACSNSRSTYEAAYNDGYNAGKTDGFDNGYEAGRDAEKDNEPSGTVIENYYEIEDMSTDDIIEYLYDNSDLGQDEYGMFVYGFIKGYNNAINGVWDEETKEYIIDWDYDGLEEEYGDQFEY